MSVLADKIRKAREKSISARGFTFVIRRPTDVEMVEFSRDRDAKSLLRFVVGWEGVKEIDLIPGGDPTPAKFDPDACAEWLTDDAELFGIVVGEVIESYQSHKTAMESSEKK